MTLTEFLSARIAEDEEAAREADGTRWLHADKVVSFEAFGPDADWVDASSPIRVDTRAKRWHIVNWSPARVLAECEAKRDIIREHVPRNVRGMDTFCDADDWGMPCPTLRALALPYADHPDFDESWRG